MSEDKIEPTPKRAERYPQPTGADVALGLTRAALAAIPFVGGSITELLSLVLAPAVNHRRDTWLKDLADGLEQLENDKFRIEDLQDNDTFISSVIQATRSALSTHRQEKRSALRNALLNIAVGTPFDEEKELFFLTSIDAFSVTHLELMRLFSDRAVYPADQRERLRAMRAITDSFVLELTDRGFLIDPRPYVARTRESADSLILQNWTISPLGKEFMAFIAAPVGLKE